MGADEGFPITTAPLPMLGYNVIIFIQARALDLHPLMCGLTGD